MRPFGLFVVAASLSVLLAAIVWPAAAELLLRLLLVTVSSTYVLILALKAGLPDRLTGDDYSPFQGSVAGARADGTPRVVREVTDELAGVDDPGRAARTEIPWSVGRTVAGEVARRLAEHHDLHLDRPADERAIRRLVSGPTWLLVAPVASAAAEGSRANVLGQVPLTRLERILDDVEKL